MSNEYPRRERERRRTASFAVDGLSEEGSRLIGELLERVSSRVDVRRSAGDETPAAAPVRTRSRTP